MIHSSNRSKASGKFWIWGGEGDEDQDPKDAGESSGAGKDAGGDGTSANEKTTEQKRIEELETQLNDTKKKYGDEKKRAEKAEKDLTDRDREGMEEHERTEAERDDYKQKYEKLLKVVETSVIDTAIRTLSDVKDKAGNPKYTWQDVEAVRAFLKKDDVKLDLDTGEVEGLEAQLAEIAKKRPYLLVPAQDSGSGTAATSGPATGGHPYGGQARQPSDRQKLGAKYKLPGFAGVSNIGAVRP